MSERACHYCGVTAAERGTVSQAEWARRELRPYGPGGSWVCHPCATGSPERRKSMESAFYTLLEANSQIGEGVVAIGEEAGPRPFHPGEGGAA
jgi:hypothetical protein